MGKHVWIGTRGAEQWIKAPAPRTAFQPVGWSATTQGRNGRLTGRRSRVTHMEYELNWPTVPTEIAQKIIDMYYGLDGDGLIHWLDPMIDNVLPAHWSFPALGVTDGPVLFGNARPTGVATAANTKSLPSVSARYSGSGIFDARNPECYIPIPPGHTAHVGVHYAGAGAGTSIVILQQVDGATNVGSAVTTPGIAASDATRFTTVVPRTAGMTGITLAIRPGATFGGVTLPTSGDIAGIMVEVLPTGQSPVGTGFTLGGGNSGCRIFEPPTQVALHAAPGRPARKSVAAKLTEVGP